MIYVRHNEPILWYWVHPKCLYNGYHIVPEKDKPIFYLDCQIPPELFFLGVRVIGIERGEDGTIRPRIGPTEYSKVVFEECCSGVRVYAPPPNFHVVVAALAAIGALFRAAQEVKAESFYVRKPRRLESELSFYVFVDRQIAAELSMRHLLYAFRPDGLPTTGSPHLLVIVYYLGGNWRWAPHVPDWPMAVDEYLTQIGANGPYNWRFKDMPIEVVFSPTNRMVVPLSRAPLPIQKIFGIVKSKK